MAATHAAQQQAGKGVRRVTTRINKPGDSGNESTASKTGGTYRYSDDASKRAAVSRVQSKLRLAQGQTLVAKPKQRLLEAGASDAEIKGPSSPDQSSSNSKFAGLKRLPLSSTSTNRMASRAPAALRRKTSTPKGTFDIWIPPELLVRETQPPHDTGEKSSGFGRPQREGLGCEKSWEHVRAALYSLHLQRGTLRKWRDATGARGQDAREVAVNFSEDLEPSRDDRIEDEEGGGEYSIQDLTRPGNSLESGIPPPGSIESASDQEHGASYTKPREHLWSKHTLSMAGPEALDLVLGSSGL